MTVAELIEMLKGIPDHYVVKTHDPDFGWDAIDRNYIWVNDNYKQVEIS